MWQFYDEIIFALQLNYRSFLQSISEYFRRMMVEQGGKKKHAKSLK